jgi:hypothetical protein
MRQLLGKSRLPSRNLTEEVYLSEHIYCQNCQITVPMGIEVVTVRVEGDFKKVVKHARYCRAHGAEYAAKALG